MKRLKWPKNLGMMLLVVWLTLTGLLPLLGIRIPEESTMLALLAVADGVLILMDR